MNVTLRIAAPDDAAIINEIFGYYIDNSVATFNEVNKTVLERRREIESLLEQYPFLVAESEGQFLGFANAEPMRPQTGYRYTVELTIYLHPHTPKHSGVGKALYRSLLDILTKQGYRSAFGALCATNTASIALHNYFGFEEAARFDCAGYKHGMWLDTLWMRKVLNPFDDSPALPIPFSQYRTQVTFESLNAFK